MHDLIILDPGTHRPSWLTARVPVITATQAAAIAGSHPYATMRDVWDEKTDPDYDRDADRNPWLMERAELGVAREPHIIDWTSEQTGLAFTPSTALVTRPGIEQYASTPDGWATVGTRPSKTALAGLVRLLAEQGEGMELADLRGGLVLCEAKATQTRWDVKGLPQHIIDQAAWQMHTTSARLVIVAAEFYEWKGKGASRHAELVGTHLFLVTAQSVHNRLLFLLREVGKFQHLLAEGIAPETDLDVTEPPAIEWDDDPETIEWKTVLAADLEAAAAHLDRIADLEAEAGKLNDELTAKQAELKAEREAMRAILKPYDGRRVSIHGARFTATLTRYNQAEVNTKALPPATLRSITTWTEKERLTFTPNAEATATEGNTP